MKLGTRVGLGPGHIVLDGDPAPPPQKGGGAPNFRPMSIVANGWMDKMPLGTEVGLGPGDFVFHVDSARKKAQPPPKFWPMSIVAKAVGV